MSPADTGDDMAKKFRVYNPEPRWGDCGPWVVDGATEDEVRDTAADGMAHCFEVWANEKWIANEHIADEYTDITKEDYIAQTIKIMRDDFMDDLEITELN